MTNLNIFSAIAQMWHYEFMQHAFEAATIVAIIAGITGYFVVLRRSAFVAHAFSDIGFCGAAGVILVGVAPIYGLILGSSLGGLAIAALGRRVSNRDTQIGIVLAFSFGLGLLFLSLYTGYATEAYSILFGEILGVSFYQVKLTLVIGFIVLVGLAVIYRPLLFMSLDEDVAEAKGMPMALLGTVFMLLVALAVSIAVQITGVLLIFSLMVTPAATAQYLTKKPHEVIIYSVIIALAASYVGLFVSFYTPYPVSFFITSIVFFLYLAVRYLPSVFRTFRRPTTAIATSQVSVSSYTE
jgi:zinc/manganese transport system permease protein